MCETWRSEFSAFFASHRSKSYSREIQLFVDEIVERGNWCDEARWSWTRDLSILILFALCSCGGSADGKQYQSLDAAVSCERERSTEVSLIGIRFRLTKANTWYVFSVPWVFFSTPEGSGLFYFARAAIFLDFHMLCSDLCILSVFFEALQAIRSFQELFIKW